MLLKEYCVRRYDLAELHEKLSRSDWVHCTAMRTTFDGVEVAFAHVGGGEYAVLIEDNGRWFEVESYTMPWIETVEKLTQMLRDTIASYKDGTRNHFFAPRRVTIALNEHHETCTHCR